VNPTQEDTFDDWEGILAKDEHIIWQGKPNGDFVFGLKNVGRFRFGLAFAGCAVFWMIGVYSSGGDFWAFGLIHFTVGLVLAFGGMFKDVYIRRRSFYSLSNKRAFVATHLPIQGRKLRFYPILPNTILDYKDGEFATIIFAQINDGARNSGRFRNIGFQRIENGKKVLGLFHDVMNGTAK
jgi:hypothetical protein